MPIFDPEYKHTGLDRIGNIEQYLVNANGGSQPALYTPQGWNANFVAALAAAGTTPARIAIVGDSVSQGYYSSDLLTKGWARLLRDSLQAVYGNGGSGFIGATLSDPWASNAGVPSGARTRYAAHGYATLVGTWTRFGPTQAGPGLSECLGTVDTTPATFTQTVTGTTVKIYTVSNTGNAAWKYSIDGAAAVSVTNAAGHNIVATTVTGLAAGSHTVTITYNDVGGTTNLYVVGVAGENATGVVANNYSVYGRFASSAVQTTAFSDASVNHDWLGGYKYPADLAIWAMGINDAGQNVTGDAYAKSLRQWMEQMRQGNTLAGNCDLAVVIPHVGKNDTTNYLYQDYAIRARGLCEAYGAALIDFWGLARNSWNKWNNLSYWGNSADPTTSGTDNVHPSDAGHAYMAAAVQSLVLKAV